MKQVLAATAVVAAGCRIAQVYQPDSESFLQANESIPVAPELMLDLKEDFSAEYSIKDMLALRDKMLADPQVAKPVSLDRYLEEMKKDPRAKSMFGFFTASFMSGSRQSGTPMHPRVILATESGALTVTFTAETEVAGTTLQNGMTLAKINVNPHTAAAGATVKLRNGDQLEVIQADPVSMRKDFYQMIFPLQASVAADASVKKNPQICASCHSHTGINGLTHMWGRYPIWDNIVGGNEDFLSAETGTFTRNQALLIERFGDEFASADCADGEQSIESTAAITDELKILQNLRYLTESGEPSYRHLDFPDADKLSPFSDIPRGKFARRPNFRLGALWHRLHIRNIHWEAKQAAYEKIKNLYLYGYLECSSAVGPDAEAALIQKYATEYAAGKYNADEAKTLIPSLKKASYDAITWENAGLSVINLSLDRMTIEFENVNKFAYKSGYFPGGDTSDRYLAALLVKDDAANAKTIPTNLYRWEKSPICNEKMGLNDYPYLRWFGFRPAPSSPENKVALCKSLMTNLGVEVP